MYYCTENHSKKLLVATQNKTLPNITANGSKCFILSELKS